MTRRMQLSFLAGTIILFTPVPILAAEGWISGQDMAALLVASGGMLFVLAIIAIGSYFAAKEKRQRLELIERLIKNGQEVPSELLTTHPNRPTPAFSRQRDIRRGIWLLCWGLGIGLVVYVASGQLKSAAWSLLFLVLSAGSFVNAMFFSGKQDSDRKREKDA